MPAKFTKLTSFPATWENDMKKIADEKYDSLNDLVVMAVYELINKEDPKISEPNKKRVFGSGSLIKVK